MSQYKEILLKLAINRRRAKKSPSRQERVALEKEQASLWSAMDKLGGRGRANADLTHLECDARDLPSGLRLTYKGTSLEPLLTEFLES